MEDQSPKPIRCKAAVCRGAGEPLTIEEIVVDPPKAYEVRVKVICTSLCHTDITFWRGNVSPAFPRILGHEAYGVVESVGEHVEGLAAGDAVVPTIVGQCGHCTTCLSEDSNRCEGVPTILGPGMRRDGTGRFWDPQGNPVHDLLAVSTFSQYTVIDVSQLSKLDPAVPPKLGCLISCGGATGVGAAWKAARLKPGSSVAIFGLGAVGLSVAQGAKMCGASKIIGVDLNPDKEKFGKAFGVTDFVNPSKLDKNNSISGVSDQGDERRRRRLQLRVHRRALGHGRSVQKHQEGEQQDDRPGRGEGQCRGALAGPGPPVRQVHHGVVLGRAQAQDPHPYPRQEMHEQGAGAGRAGHA
ncbi:hypothetical protein PVAP13_9NG816500 [Panicum virgatum]|uniref:Uncharacterized protein n=1 Tax=Panicum virgatum TaxID=38727 RepID=A0A8T0N146_PANVG|nr:hypothetical protein PVAP13_9NG816500 [Panicum virgatum]